MTLVRVLKKLNPAAVAGQAGVAGGAGASSSNNQFFLQLKDTTSHMMYVHLTPLGYSELIH